MNEQRSESKGNSGKFSTLLNVCLIVIIVAGLGYWVIDRNSTPSTPDPTRTDNQQIAPPELTITTGEKGKRVEIDEAAFTKWCIRHDLPEPPAMGPLEPEVANRLWTAFVDAARDPSAANLGKAGQICESLQAHDSAKALLKRAVAMQPREFRWTYLLGCIAQRVGDLPGAQNWFAKAVDIDDQYPLLFARYGQVLFDDHEHDQAERMFLKYNERDETGILGDVGLARIALKRGDAEKAVTILQAALRRQPNDFQVRLKLGDALVAAGRPNEARPHFDAARQLDTGLRFNADDRYIQELDTLSGSVDLLVTELRQLQGGPQHQRMADLIEKIIERRPDDMLMVMNLAETYRMLGRIADAFALLDDVAGRSGRNARWYTVRAALLLGEGRATEAETNCRQAIELDPRNARAFDVLSRIHFQNEQWPECEEAIRSAIDVGGPDPSRWYVLAEALLAQRRLSDAREYYAKVLTQQPRNEKVARRLNAIDAALARIAAESSDGGQ